MVFYKRLPRLAFASLAMTTILHFFQRNTAKQIQSLREVAILATTKQSYAKNVNRKRLPRLAFASLAMTAKFNHYETKPKAIIVSVAISKAFG